MRHSLAAEQTYRHQIQGRPRCSKEYEGDSSFHVAVVPHTGCYGCWVVVRPEAEGAETGKLRRRQARARSLRRKKTQEGRWRAGLSPGTRCASETRCLKANIISLRNRWLEDRAEELNSAAAITDPNLSMKVSECSPNVAVKLRQLHALETQAVAIVQKMMTILSEVLPI